MIWDLPEDSPTGSISYLASSVDEWRERIAQRRPRWAAEDAERVAAWETDRLDQAAARAAAWPVERITALMAATREEGRRIRERSEMA